MSGRGEGLGLGAAVVYVSICQPCRQDPSSVACTAACVTAHCTRDVTPSAPLYKSGKLEDVLLAHVV